MRQKILRIDLQHLTRREEVLNRPCDGPSELFTGNGRCDPQRNCEVLGPDPLPEHGRLNGDADGLVDGVRVDVASGTRLLKLLRHDAIIVIRGNLRQQHITSGS